MKYKILFLSCLLSGVSTPLLAAEPQESDHKVSMGDKVFQNLQDIDTFFKEKKGKENQHINQLVKINYPVSNVNRVSNKPSNEVALTFTDNLSSYPDDLNSLSIKDGVWLHQDNNWVWAYKQKIVGVTEIRTNINYLNVKDGTCSLGVGDDVKDYKKNSRIKNVSNIFQTNRSSGFFISCFVNKKEDLNLSFTVDNQSVQAKYQGKKNPKRDMKVNIVSDKNETGRELYAYLKDYKEQREMHREFCLQSPMADNCRSSRSIQSTEDDRYLQKVNVEESGYASYGYADYSNR